MEEFISSFLLVAVAEMGDRTQILALALAARYRQTVSVILGIAVATLANHLIAAALGQGLNVLIGAEATRYVVGAAFIAFAVWALVPDRADDKVEKTRWGAFLGTAILFFFVEIGDKTQLATIALAAHYASIVLVAIASTLGLLAANAPVVVLGNIFAERLPMTALRWVAAGLFALFGVLTLLDIGWTLDG